MSDFEERVIAKINELKVLKKIFFIPKIGRIEKIEGF